MPETRSKAKRAKTSLDSISERYIRLSRLKELIILELSDEVDRHTGKSAFDSLVLAYSIVALQSQYLQAMQADLNHHSHQTVQAKLGSCKAVLEKNLRLA